MSRTAPVTLAARRLYYLLRNTCAEIPDMKYPLALAALTLVAISLAGCPPQQIPIPPFDATGTYAGTWTGTQDGDGAKQEVLECPLTLTLTQNVAAPFPQNFGVQGTAVINYDCFDLPAWLETPPPSTVNVSGVLETNGRLTLLSGACGTGACVILSLAGAGAEIYSNGTMDTYDGNWNYAIALAGVAPFGFTGTYTTDRAEE